MRVRLAAALICLPVALASAVALAADRDTFCTLMAGPSGLRVVLSRPALDPRSAGETRRLARAIRREHPGWSVRRIMGELRRRTGPADPDPIRRTTVCVRQRCITRHGPWLDGVGGIRTAPGYQRLPVRVVLDYRDGRRKVLRARVAMRPYEINGPRCGTEWVATVVVAGDRPAVAYP